MASSRLKNALKKMFSAANRGPTYTGSLYPQGTKPVQGIRTGSGGALMQRDYGGSTPPAAAPATAGPVSPAAAMPAVAAAALRSRPPASTAAPEAAQVRVPNFGHELPPGFAGQSLPGVEAGVGVGDDVVAQYTDRPNAQPINVRSPGTMRFGPGAVPGPHMDDVGFHDEELEPVTPLGEGGQELPYETMLTEGQPDTGMADRMVHSVIQDPKLMQMIIRMLRARGGGDAQFQ